MANYIVTYSKTIQVSEENWKVTNPVFEVSDYTTIGEISKFLREANGDELIIRKVNQLEK